MGEQNLSVHESEAGRLEQLAEEQRALQAGERDAAAALLRVANDRQRSIVRLLAAAHLLRHGWAGEGVAASGSPDAVVQSSPSSQFLPSQSAHGLWLSEAFVQSGAAPSNSAALAVDESKASGGEVVQPPVVHRSLSLQASEVITPGSLSSQPAGSSSQASVQALPSSQASEVITLAPAQASAPGPLQASSVHGSQSSATEAPVEAMPADITSDAPAPLLAADPPLETLPAEVTSATAPSQSLLVHGSLPSPTPVVAYTAEWARPSQSPRIVKAAAGAPHIANGAHEKVPCTICGKLVNLSAMPQHKGSRPCLALRAEQDTAAKQAPAPATPAVSAAPARLRGGDFRSAARSLLGGGMGRAALAKSLGLVRADFDEIMDDERRPTSQDVARMQALLDKAVAPTRGAALRAVEREAGVNA